MRRSAVSIPSNIAEGAARKGDKELIQFLYIALGSICEVETQYLIAVRLKFTNKDEVIEGLLLNVKKTVLGFKNYVSKKS
jgi:four helix bundle protein